MKNKVVAVAGPTAVGKTKFAIEIAKAFGGEIVSCDSMQIYKYMNIGSAKPTPEEMKEAVHHLVDFVDPAAEFSVAKYQPIAKEAIFDILNRDKLPIVSGGTGLYLNSLLYKMDFSGSADSDYRKSLWKIAEEQGNEALHNMLKGLDEEAANVIHPNNVKKVIRAIERINSGEAKVKDFNQANEPVDEYEMVLIGLTRDRQELYDRINRRVDILVEQGLIDEVKGLMDMGFVSADIAMKGIGYKEIIDYLNGEYDLPTAIDLVKKNTRHYAKKQLTWFRRYDNITWFDISEYESDDDAASEMIKWLDKRL